MSGEEDPALQHMWFSKVHARWQGVSFMTTARQKELIEEYVAELPPLPYGCPRRTRPIAVTDATAAAAAPGTTMMTSEQRDQWVRLASSALLPPLTAVFIEHSHASSGKRFVQFQPGERLLDYRGWILTEDEYDRFGYAIHTGVSLSRLYISLETTYVLMGDPTAPAVQVNCFRGTGKLQPNAQLIKTYSQLDMKPDGQHYATDALLTVRATQVLKAGTEVWLDYGADFWRQLGYHCPHCLEYDDGAPGTMLLCDAPDCMRAWHRRCLHLSSVSAMPKDNGDFYCDLHAHLAQLDH